MIRQSLPSTRPSVLQHNPLQRVMAGLLHAGKTLNVMHEAGNDCRCQALHSRSDAAALAAVMENIHTYYKQFQSMVQERLQKELAPIEKHLKVRCPALVAA